MMKRQLWLVLSGVGALGLVLWLGSWLEAQRPQTPERLPVSGAAASLNINELGHLGGLADTVFVSGSLAYAGLGAEIAILDITNPYTPTRLGYFSLPALVTDMEVVGQIAYVAAAESGLHLLNVQNPTAPIYLGTYTVTGQVEAVVVQGTIAYIAESRTTAPYGRITSVDVSNPALPVMLGTRTLNAPVYGLALGGTVLYAAADYGGLRIFDINNPTAINQIGSLATPGWARGMAFQGQFVYIIQTNCSGECNGYLSIVNVNDPAHPVASSNTLLPGSGANLVVQGNYAYLADRNGGLRVMNIVDASAPYLIASYDTPGSAFDVFVYNSLAYVADESGGLRIYNVFDPNTIIPIGHYTALNRAQDAVISGTTAYVADWSGVQVVDISNPTLPVLGTRLLLPDVAEHIALYGHYAYVAAGDVGGIRILDLSNPTVPSVVGYYDTPGEVHRITIQDNLAYVADGANGVLILDLVDPVNPTQVGAYDTPGVAWDVVLEGNIAYVADQGLGMRVLDVNEPGNPVEIGAQTVLGQAVSVALSGSTAYVAALSGYLVVIDVSQPTMPTVVATINTAAWVYRVLVRDNSLYAAASQNGLRVFDVTSPTLPIEMAYLDTGGTVRAMSLSQGQIIIADLSGGVSLAQEAYEVRGMVTDHAGVPQPGVHIQASNGLTGTTGPLGIFTLPGVAGGTHILTPTLPDFRFSPAHLQITVGPAISSANFLVFPAPVTVTLTGSLTTTLRYTDTQGMFTQLTFPPGAVLTTTTVVVTPTLVTLNSHLLTPIGHNFDLAAYQSSSWLPNFAFAQPVQVKIRYSDEDLGGGRETAMYLGRWTGEDWPDAAATCVPPSSYNHNLPGNTISLDICQTGSYALLLRSALLYLPFVPRNQ